MQIKSFNLPLSPEEQEDEWRKTTIFNFVRKKIVENLKSLSHDDDDVHINLECVLDTT